MKVTLFILSLLCALVLGACLDKLLINPTVIHQWMPVKLTDADMARLATLRKKGDTYTRYAPLSGAYGVTATRIGDGVWVSPTSEVGSRMSGNKELSK